MDKWIGKFVDKYNELIFENHSLDVNNLFHHINFKRLPKGFIRCVSDYLLYYYYTFMNSNSLGDSVFDFILVHRSTLYAIKADFYYGFVSIFVVVQDSETEFFNKILIGKYSISRFLSCFVSGQELDEFHSKDNQSYDVDYDQFEIPF